MSSIPTQYISGRIGPNGRPVYTAFTHGTTPLCADNESLPDVLSIAHAAFGNVTLPFWNGEAGAFTSEICTVAPTLESRIDAYVAHADRLSAEHWQACGYTHTKPPTHRADYISGKWCRVVNVEERNGIPTDASVYAFVALEDFTTKTLGHVVKGGIYKPASFKAPAKHARGSVFADDFGNGSEHGPAYLR